MAGGHSLERGLGAAFPVITNVWGFGHLIWIPLDFYANIQSKFPLTSLNFLVPWLFMGIFYQNTSGYSFSILWRSWSSAALCCLPLCRGAMPWAQCCHSWAPGNSWALPGCQSSICREFPPNQHWSQCPQHFTADLAVWASPAGTLLPGFTSCWWAASALLLLLLLLLFKILLFLHSFKIINYF